MKLLERLIALVVPFQCLGCGMEGNLICDRCRGVSCTPVPPRCFGCRVFSDNYRSCVVCSDKYGLKSVYVRTELSGAPRKLLQRYKFERAQAAAELIADLMTENLPALHGYIVIPVPTATSRVRERGYDHSLLLARSLAKRLGLPMRPLLLRLNQTRQVGAGREQRLNQLRGAMRVSGAARQYQGRKVLLVDDVTTTGATLKECALVLTRAGIGDVSAVVFAQR